MEVRKKLIRRPRGRAPEIAIDRRGDWTGWFELLTEPLNEHAIFNTARIVGMVGADILGVVEADNRIVLSNFNRDILGAVCKEPNLKQAGAKPYAYAMLIDGNDERGIDVGILTKQNYPIHSVQTHIFDEDKEGLIFSRDCAEYVVSTPTNEKILCLINHFKSKGFGSKASSDEKRMRQAQRVAQIYQERRKTFKYVVVMGDLNDTPGSTPLAALMATDLKDVSATPAFDDGGRPGTYANGTASNKIDYLLCSPALFAKIKKAGIDRRGVWGGTHGTLFPHIETITKESEAASDHAVIWADFDL